MVVAGSLLGLVRGGERVKGAQEPRATPSLNYVVSRLKPANITEFVAPTYQGPGTPTSPHAHPWFAPDFSDHSALSRSLFLLGRLSFPCFDTSSLF